MRIGLPLESNDLAALMGSGEALASKCPTGHRFDSEKEWFGSARGLLGALDLK